MKALPAMTLACLLATGTTAHGACAFYPGSGHQMVSAHLGAQVIVSSMASVGDILWQGTAKGNSARVECTQPDELDNGLLADPGPQQGPDGVYPTNVAGVGMRIEEESSRQPLHWPRLRSAIGAGIFTATPAYFITLVKTGDIHEDRLHLSSAGASRRYGALEAIRLQFDSDVDIVLRQPTCSVAPGSQHIMVDLGEPLVRDFNGPGSGSGLVPFNLRLACHGGGGGDRLYVSVTLTDATEPSNRSKVLGLRQDARARGVGVEIQFQGNPVQLGPESAADGDPARWPAGSVINGQATFDVPLQARYLQTENTITAGSAGALATFTFAYD